MLELVKLDSGTLPAIANAIREKTGDTDLMLPSEMPARIEAIETGGVNYLDYCQNAQFASLNLFGSKKVEIYLPNGRSLNNMFNPLYKTWAEYEAAANKTVEELIIHCPNKITGIQQIFQMHTAMADYKLKKLTFDVDFSEATNLNYAFKGLDALEVIDGTPIYLGAVTVDLTAFWTGGRNLREIRFAGKLAVNCSFGSSPKRLSKDSIQNIMSCLSDDATGKSLTIPVAAVNSAFETSEGIADGSTSAEWLALIEAHSNWTISLV